MYDICNDVFILLTIKNSEKMKRFFKNNKFSIAVVSVFCLLVISMISIFVSCNKEGGIDTNKSESDTSQISGVEYPIPEIPITLISDIHFIKEGEIGWFDTDGKGIPVSSTSAQFHYLPNDIKNYDEYYNLIKGDDNSKYNILKITFGEDMTYFSSVPAIPIIHVEKPTQEEVDNVLKMFEYREDDIKQINLLNSMTSQQAQ